MVNKMLRREFAASELFIVELFLLITGDNLEGNIVSA
jgi:hypothetical protein